MRAVVARTESPTQGGSSSHSFFEDPYTHHVRLKTKTEPSPFVSLLVCPGYATAGVELTCGLDVRQMSHDGGNAWSVSLEEKRSSPQVQEQRCQAGKGVCTITNRLFIYRSSTY